MKTNIIIIVLIFAFEGLWAQSSRIDSLLDVIVFSDVEQFDYYAEMPSEKQNYHFLYLRSSMNNKTFYAGREISDNMYNLSGQAFYFNSLGFFAGVAGVGYSEVAPMYTTTLLSVGYGKTIKKLHNIRLSASYDRYLYNNSDEDYEPTYNSGLSFGASFREKWFNVRANYNLMMGNEFGSQISLSTGAKINLLKFGRSNKLTFEPQISVYYGNESIENATVSYMPDDYLYEEPIYDYTSEEKFGLMNTQINLPLSLYYKNFDFEASFNYNLPQTASEYYSYDNSYFFNISVGYVFSLNKGVFKKDWTKR